MLSQTPLDPQATAVGHLAVIETYGPPSPMLAPEALASRQQDGTLPVPTGWALDAGYETTLSVTFVDAAGSGQVQTLVTMPATFGFLTKGSETIQLDVTELGAEGANAWAAYVEVPATMEQVPLGSGFARGKAAVINRGTSLLRAVYNGGTVNVLDPAAVQERVQTLLTEFT
jgi:hypothetical protein